MTKLKNSKFDKTPKLKLWQNATTQIVTNSKTKIVKKKSLKKLWQNSNFVTKVFFLFFSSKLWQLKKSNCERKKNLNSSYDKTQLKIWQNSKTQIVTKKQKHKLRQNSKSRIVTKLKNSNCEQTQKLKLWQNLKNLTLWQNTKIKLWHKP